MNTLPKKTTATGFLLTVSSTASAHGNGTNSSTLFHYLNSPDHLTTFVVLAITAIGTGIFVMRPSLKTARNQKR